MIICLDKSSAWVDWLSLMLLTTKMPDQAEFGIRQLHYLVTRPELEESAADTGIDWFLCPHTMVSLQILISIWLPRVRKLAPCWRLTNYDKL